MTTWEKFLTALIWVRNLVTAGFSTVPAAAANQVPGEAGAGTGAIAARQGAPASAAAGVDIEGIPKVNVSVSYSDAAQADLTVYTWFMDVGEDWYQYEADSAPTVLINEARAATTKICGQTLETLGWQRVHFEILSSDAGVGETVSIGVFPYNA